MVSQPDGNRAHLVERHLFETLGSAVMIATVMQMSSTIVDVDERALALAQEELGTTGPQRHGQRAP